MTLRDDIEDLLIAWGRVYGKGREYFEERSPTGNSNLARIIGKPKQESTVKRNGISRRVMMAQSMLVDGKSVTGLMAVPKWSCDPCRGVQTRSFKPETDIRETPTMTRVQAAWLALHRISEQEATAIRIHYQRRDLSREQRARELSLTVRAYRDAVARGREYIRGRIAA